MRIFCVLLLLALPLAAADYDLLIRNARIVDGTGNPWRRGDVAVRNGRIAAVGRLSTASATEIVDAHDRILAPGFIDVHTHLETSIRSTPAADSFLFDGVTTAVTGNCGGSDESMATLFDDLQEVRPGINVASLIGHNTVRHAVMGDANRPATPGEVDRMASLVDKAMREGAVGFSTGLIYIPGTYARTEEVAALAKAAAARGGVYATHMRNEGDDIVNAVEEACAIGKEAGMPVEISHLKVRAGMEPAATKILAMLEQYRRDGLDVTADQYPYPASATTITTQLPSWALADGKEAIAERLHSAGTRGRIAAEMKQRYVQQGRADLSFIQITSYKPHREYEGKRITEIATLQARPPGIEGQIETVLDIVDAGGAGVIYFIWSVPAVDQILREPGVAVASDAGVAQPGVGMPHPRAYGTNAKVLGEFVRERHVIPLEDAIRKMTGLPARTFSLKDRGEIREGYWADLVLFDPARVKDKSTFEAPHQYSEGFDYVWVNGVAAISGGRRTEARTGSPIRKQ